MRLMIFLFPGHDIRFFLKAYLDTKYEDTEMAGDKIFWSVVKGENLKSDLALECRLLP